MPANKEENKNKNKSEIFVNMAHALTEIAKDVESEEEKISNKSEVLGQIRDDLLNIYCNYKLFKK